MPKRTDIFISFAGLGLAVAGDASALGQVGAPPPPVSIGSAGDLATAFSDLPAIVTDKGKARILGFEVIGKTDSLGALATKLGADKWQTQIMQRPGAVPFLYVDAGGKTLRQVMDLKRAFDRRDFGPLSATLSSIPDPSPRK